MPTTGGCLQRPGLLTRVDRRKTIISIVRGPSRRVVGIFFNSDFRRFSYSHYPVHMDNGGTPCDAYVRPSSLLLSDVLSVNREPLADIKLPHYSAPATLTCLSLPHLCTRTHHRCSFLQHRSSGDRCCAS
jgi:hypothetical protein